MIDPASRQPDDPEPTPPVAPPPIGTGPAAAGNLFTRATVAAATNTPAVADGPPAVDPEASYYWRLFTDTAVSLSARPETGKFTTAQFGDAVQYEFEMRAAPGADWCRAVLVQIPWVTRLPGGDHWKIQTG